MRDTTPSCSDQTDKEFMKHADWPEFVQGCKSCTHCRNAGLLDPEAFPLFTETVPCSFEILFILEAPNRDDTYNPAKRCLTIDSDTDPSGRFLSDLLKRELEWGSQAPFVTNSVLCLPAGRDGKYPVRASQRRYCLPLLKRMIISFDPIIVCTLGAKALAAADAICEHGLRKMSGCAAKSVPWFGRLLFPLYHTGLQVRNLPNGRSEAQQRKDWRGLKELWEQHRRCRE